MPIFTSSQTMLAALMSIVALGAAQENDSASAKAPSVIFTLVDDNGWAGVSETIT